jgi:carbon-monoxide dehydrogenase iron sulfur subunit
LITDLRFSEMNSRLRQSLVANPTACTGCLTCETACSLMKTGHIFPAMARIRIDRDPFEGRFVPNICHQCSDPYCLKACPVGAIGISRRNGAVLIDRKKCVGCKSCQRACPYGMIVFDEEGEKSFKCDLCGGNPQCIKACPTHALGMAYFGGKVPT